MADIVIEKKPTGAEQVLWDLSVFYQGMDDPQIDTDLARLNTLTDEFAAKYRGKVAELTSAQWVEAYQALAAIYALFGKASTFAGLNFSTATNDPQVGAFMQKIREYGSQLQQKVVFFELEWNALDDDAAAKLLADPALGAYRYLLEAERRYKPYQLSEPEEKILIEKSVTGGSAWVRFFTQLTSAMQYDFEGEKLNQARILAKLQEPDRTVRQKAANILTAGLREKSMELTYIFNVLAAEKASDDKLRRYPSWVSSRNLSNKASDDVVNALISAVTSRYDLVARHYRIKRALLGYDELFDYDRYAPLNLKESDEFYTWSQAQTMVTEAYTAFSPRLGKIAGRFFSENWIHAPVLDGKRGGAFASYGTKATHPFVFVNYLGRADDVMTLAHELGHGVHMYLANEAQNEFTRYTPLTTAEMASTFGEMVVFQNLIQQEPDKEIRLSMLAQKIEDTFGTVFRQISMNRFEDAMHTARRSEGELTTDRFNELWIGTQRAMFGESVTLRDEYQQWWSYVPHFLHTPGYVYAYAFGELLVLALYTQFQKEGSSFVPKYEALLAAGDSDYPEKLLANVGINLSDPNFWQQGIAVIQALVDEEEALAKALYPAKF
jgi:oligoendopeptidase F